MMEQVEQEYQDEISLKELLLILLENKKRIVVITLSIVILSLLGSLYMASTSEKAQLILSFNGSKMAVHQNPDGTKFDPYQVATPYILRQVVTELGMEGQLTSNQIRSLIEMEPIIPKEITDQRDFAMEKNGETIKFYPNEYMLTVNSSKKYGVSGLLAQEIANQLVVSYAEYYSNEYILQKPVVNKLNAFEQERYDYADISYVLNSQITLLKDFNNRLADMDTDFRAKRTGMTFHELNNLVSTTDSVALNKLDAMISSYKLTKDDARLILYYEYLIEQLEYRKSKISGEEEVTKAMLQSIEDSTTALLKITEDASVEADNSYFNSLILKSASTGTQVNSIDQQIAYYQNEVDQLKAGSYIVDYDREAVLVETEALIGAIIKDLQQWIQLSKDTSEEFYDQYLSNAVYALSPAVVKDGVKLPLNLAIGLVLGVMLGCFEAFFRHYWKTSEGGL